MWTPTRSAAQGWTISAIARHLGHDRRTIRAYLTCGRVAGQRASTVDDPLAPFVGYLRQRLADDPHVWATALFDEVVALGFDRSYPTFTRGLRTHRLRPHCEPCASSRGRDHAVIAHPPGEEVQWDWVELPESPEHWNAGAHAHLLVGALPASGKWRGVLADAEDLPHLVEALHAVSARLGGLPKRWRFDRMATVASPNTGRVTATFAAVAKHYGVHVDLCAPRHGNRKGTVEKANYSAAQRWWRTLPTDLSVAQAQASLDAFCARVGDGRVRKRDGDRTTVGALAALEPLAPLPPALPATVTGERIVSSQALVAFRGNSYSVPPGLAGTPVTVSHRLGEQVLDVTTAAGTVLARHRREPDGAGVLVRDTVHVTALESAVLAASVTGKPCGRKRVANRCVDPRSKLSAAEWASFDAAIPGLTVIHEDQAYRAMDLLVEADAQAQVQEAVFFAVADLLNLEVDLLFFDTTSTYFERDTEEAPTEQQPAGGLRRYGHSKDSRSDLPQIVIGLAVTREGIPVRCWVWPGNTADVAVLPEVKDDLRGWRLGRVVTVVDRGFSSRSNLDYLRRAGGHWIAGERMRDGNAQAQAALSRQGRYRQVRDNLRVKEVTLDGESGIRWIVCHNPHEAERDAARRTEALTRLTAELERIKSARTRDDQRRKAGKKTSADDVHVRAECTLRDHPTLGRWLRQLPSGRLALDKTKIAAEQRLDGKYLLSTSDPDLSAEDVALGYKNLLEAERGLRDLKSTLDLRPVFHRVEPRIRAHVLLCWLALLLIRVAERRTGLTWRRIELELSRLHAVTLTGSAGTVVQTTPLTDAQAGILRACQVAPPPHVTTLHPA